MDVELYEIHNIVDGLHVYCRHKLCLDNIILGSGDLWISHFDLEDFYILVICMCTLNKA